MKRLAWIAIIALGLSSCNQSGDASRTPTAPTYTALIMNVTAHAGNGLATGCPMTIGFSGTVTTKGSGLATYRWELSDGRQTDAQGFTFNNPMVYVGDFQELGQGNTTVNGPSLTASKDGLVWATLHMLTPQDVSSQPAYWNVVCGS